MAELWIGEFYNRFLFGQGKKVVFEDSEPEDDDEDAYTSESDEEEEEEEGVDDDDEGVSLLEVNVALLLL